VWFVVNAVRKTEIREHRIVKKKAETPAKGVNQGMRLSPAVQFPGIGKQVCLKGAVKNGGEIETEKTPGIRRPNRR
jgi:hypothetical protein